MASMRQLVLGGVVVSLSGCLALPLGPAGQVAEPITISDTGRLDVQNAYVGLSPADSASYRVTDVDNKRTPAPAASASPTSSPPPTAARPSPSDKPERGKSDDAHEGADGAEGRPPASPSPLAVVTPPPRPAGVDFDIAYVGHALPIEMLGLTVQADDLIVRGNQAFIAYNYAGDKFLGAIQILDISDPARPVITKEIKFTDLDVNCLWLDGDRLLFGGGANPDVRPFKAFVGAIDLHDITPGKILGSLKGLHSYAATSIAGSGDRLYVSVGAKDGGIEVLDKQLASVQFMPADDVRDLAAYRSGIVALAGTTDTTRAKPAMMVIDGKADRSVPLDADLGRYTKATIEVLDGHLGLLALSHSGLMALDLDKPGAGAFQLGNPTDSELFLTNSASSDQGLVFVANGEYGFRCLKLKGSDPASGDFATLLGHHELNGAAYGNSHYSANQIAFQGNHLFVASGLGGVNIYQLRRGAAEPSAASPTPTPSAAPSSPVPSARPSEPKASEKPSDKEHGD